MTKIKSPLFLLRKPFWSCRAVKYIAKTIIKQEGSIITNTKRIRVKKRRIVNDEKSNDISVLNSHNMESKSVFTKMVSKI